MNGPRLIYGIEVRDYDAWVPWGPWYDESEKHEALAARDKMRETLGDARLTCYEVSIVASEVMP